MNDMLIGVDISKNVFVMHGMNSRGKEILRKKASRGDFLDVLAGYPGSVIAMEACGGANHWGRELQRRGYEVRLLAPNHVKPYVRSQKNDLEIGIPSTSPGFEDCRPVEMFFVPRELEIVWVRRPHTHKRSAPRKASL